MNKLLYRFSQGFLACLVLVYFKLSVIKTFVMVKFHLKQSWSFNKAICPSLPLHLNQNNHQREKTPKQIVTQPAQLCLHGNFVVNLCQQLLKEITADFECRRSGVQSPVKDRVTPKTLFSTEHSKGKYWLFLKK